MLGLLPDGLRERISDHLDKIIHTAMAATVTFTGLSLEDLVMIIPAIVSVVISILAWIARRRDRAERRAIYQREEERRTAELVAWLKNLPEDGTKDAASVAMMKYKATKKVSELGRESDDE